MLKDEDITLSLLPYWEILYKAKEIVQFQLLECVCFPTKDPSCLSVYAFLQRILSI